jgi:uncharacterized delta-60 repeat protein
MVKKISIVLFLFLLWACGIAPCPNSRVCTVGGGSSGSGGGGGGGSGSSTPIVTLSLGTLETTFGASGIVNVPGPTSPGEGYSILKQTDGKIILAGRAGNADTLIARFLSDGTLDTSYNAGSAYVQTDYSATIDGAFGAAIQTDDKVVLFGYSGGSGTETCLVSRFTTSAILDSTFNTNGYNSQVYPTGTICILYGGLVQTDNKAVSVGYMTVAGNDRPVIARYTTAGSLETSTPVNLGASTGHNFRAVIQLGDGSLIAGGYYHNGVNSDILLAKFNTSLTLDTTFGTAGTVIQNLGNDEQAHSLVADTSGNIFVGGYNDAATVAQFLVAKFRSDGSLDTTFGSAGFGVQDVTGGADRAHAILLQVDNKILLLGEGGAAAAAYNTHLMRFYASGVIDTTFGVGGIRTVDMSAAAVQDFANSMIAYDANTIVTGGHARFGGNFRLVVGKFK